MPIFERNSSTFRARLKRIFLNMTSLPAWTSYTVAVIVVALATWSLVGLQNFVADYDQLKKGPTFVAVYFIAIALATIFGGMNAGLLSVLLSLFCTAYFLLPPSGAHFSLTMSNSVTLAIVTIVGALVALGMEGLRSNTRLLLENLNLLAVEHARANREAVLNTIGQTVRTANNPDQVQIVSVESLGKTLHVDGCYFLRLNTSKDSAVVGHYWRKDGQPAGTMSLLVSEMWPAVKLLTQTRKTIVFNDCRTDPYLSSLADRLEVMGVRSGVIVPLFIDDQLDSALAVAMFHAPRLWDPSDVHLVEAVAAQSRGASDALRLQQKEHKIAVQLQAALQPELSLNVPSLDIASYYRAALEEANVGGDFFDGFALGGGKYALVVGDVSGKGLAAASQVAAIRNMLRCLLQTVETIESAIALLNHVLVKQNLLPSFATLIVAIFDPFDMSVEYVSCGHEPALLYRAQSNGKVEELETTGPVIGIFKDNLPDSDEPLFTRSKRKLQRGDALLLYTDGVCDAGADSSRLLGVQGITRHLTEFFANEDVQESDPSETRAARLLEYCMEQTEKFAKGVLRDDICLLAVVIEADSGMSGADDSRSSPLKFAKNLADPYDDDNENPRIVEADDSNATTVPDFVFSNLF